MKRIGNYRYGTRYRDFVEHHQSTRNHAAVMLFPPCSIISAMRVLHTVDLPWHLLIPTAHDSIFTSHAEKDCSAKACRMLVLFSQKVEGVVKEGLPSAMFRVEVGATGKVVLCTISGRIRKNFVRILVGDPVRVELSPYDLTRGRITFRYK